jgi:hypothetical protein
VTTRLVTVGAGRARGAASRTRIAPWATAVRAVGAGRSPGGARRGGIASLARTDAARGRAEALR